MKIPPAAGVLVALSFLALPLAAREAPTLPIGTAAPQTAPEETEEPPIPGKFMPGEIREVSGGGFTVLPYDIMLPKRVQVRLGPKTRIFEEKKGTRADIRVGDMVAVVDDQNPPPPEVPIPELPKERGPRPTTPTPSRPVLPVAFAGPQASRSAAPEATTDTEATPGYARAVIRMGAAGAGMKPTQADSRTGAFLIRAARSLVVPQDRRARAEWRGGKRKPRTGVVTSLEPFEIQGERRVRRFQLDPKARFVIANPVGSAALKGGKNVTLLNPGGLRPDGTVEAELVALAPKPALSTQEQRNILLREQGRVFKRTDISP